MERFKDKVAIVTGGGNGLGKVICTRLVKEGAKVVIAEWEPEPLAEVCAELGGAATGVLTDVSKREQVDAMVSQAIQKHGHIDLLFSNAGVCDYNLFLEETEENWDRNFNINTRGTFNVGQAVAREMVRQGTGGSIINIGSEAYEVVSPATSAYAASKAAITQLTRVMAVELSRYNIRVNAVGPGPLLTRMTAKSRANPERMESFMKKLVDARYGLPEEAAAVALFLASDEASFATGGMYFVDGGHRVK
jgi:NAD(P)-dependent dehydrogenase (short-subunit alcohol dehydrogenase family)